MGKLRDLMDRDLAIRGYSAGTCQQYLSAVEKLARFWKKSPDQLTLDDINRYQLYMVREAKVSWSYFNVAVCALRFFYKTTLKRDWDIKLIPYHRTGRKLPEVPSPEEVALLFGVIEDPRDRAIYMIAYGAGLRLSEIRFLRVSDIDSHRMVIRVQEGKGLKDRYTPLPETALPILRDYWKLFRPTIWMFPGRYENVPISATQIGNRLRYYVALAGLSRQITCHTLRHAYATHSLEKGGNIRVIQEILGHRSLRTTEKYTHVAKNFLQNAKSPLDDMPSGEASKESEPKA